MKVYFVGAGPGAPDLLTIRGKTLLEGARYCVYAGSLINPELLNLLPPGCKKYNSADMSLEEIVEVIVRAQEEGVDVIRLHSGDPSIYGSINEQMDRLDELPLDTSGSQINTAFPIPEAECLARGLDSTLGGGCQ